VAALTNESIEVGKELRLIGRSCKWNKEVKLSRLTQLERSDDMIVTRTCGGVGGAGKPNKMAVALRRV
jgi:hypothetical protein